jgi:phosphate:Na+ symporter
MLLGGLGFLLFGMKMMSGGLETIAGDTMQVFLRRAAGNRFLAVAVGIVATIAINSSTATTLITVSFVNSAMLTLQQSIGIIMGANVGTTFSTQLIAFGMGAVRLNIVAVSIVFAGAVFYIFTSKSTTRNIGYVLLGLGIMLFGITYMSDAMRPLRDNDAFRDFLVGFDNPALALLAGFAVTAIIQSSTATTAILVTLLASGIAMPFQTAAFILLGVNIGTSLTTVIASIPANRDSKRAALFHIMYDIIGSVVFGTLILVFPGILQWFTNTWGAPEQQAAMFHTLYNVSTMLLLLPFVHLIAKLMQKIVPVVEEKTGKIHDKKLQFLDSGMPANPTSAVINAHAEVCRMANITRENLVSAADSLFGRDNTKKVLANEKVINFLNHKITAHLAQINRMRLSPAEANKVGKMFIIISDIERIGDHAANLATLAQALHETKLSPDAVQELTQLVKKVCNLLTQAIQTYDDGDKDALPLIKKAAKKIDKRVARNTQAHIERLKAEICNPEAGVIFTAILNDLERTTAHAKNIAFSISLEERKWQ